MKAVDERRYARIQDYELEFWRNNPVDFQVLWGHYLPPFAEHLETHYGTVVDVGSGPKPFFLCGLFEYDVATAVDPLINKYAKFPEYASMYSGFSTCRSIWGIEDEVADVVFAFNVLDHVRDPEGMISELARICKPGGKLFLFVDIDKLPDHMHPHLITSAWVRACIEPLFEVSLWHKEPSWKFSNACLWFVGVRLSYE